MYEPRIIKMDDEDNVAIIASDFGLPSGTLLPQGLHLNEHIPQGHKVALCDIAQGGDVRRYNVVIGKANMPIKAGSWVNEHKLDMPPAPDLNDLPLCTGNQTPGPPILDRTFMGYRNTDGSAGTRNLLGVTTTVQCVSGIVEHAVKRIKSEILPNFPNVDGVLSLEHTYGCGVAINAPDAVIPIRTLRNIAANPNFGGEIMTVGLGCEKLQPDVLFPRSHSDTASAVVRLQDDDGFEAMVKRIMATAEIHLDRLNQRQRQTCSVSELVVGLQCGGSDAFSGVTANPALGIASDLLVRAGATVMFSENTEIRDGIAQLTARAANPDIAKALIHELGWYDAYLARGHVDRAANTTPGNKAGGLSNIVEKAMGSIVKSGSSPIMGVVAPGERVQTKGLNYAATPASDFICGTLQLAAGANVHVFTTGRGTPYSLEAMPTIKVATQSHLAKRWHDLIDLDAGAIATGEASHEEIGMQIFEHIIAVASGRPTWAERHGTHNALALFNPAPVT